MPYEEPKQEYPLEPPQLPSLETFAFETAEDAAAGAEDDAARTEDDAARTEDDAARTEDDTTAAADDETDEVQSPNPPWQPVPQYADVEPQYPFTEQQFPNDEFLQVSLFLDCVPQRAEVLMVRALILKMGRAVMATSRAKCIVYEGRRKRVTGLKIRSVVVRKLLEGSERDYILFQSHRNHRQQGY